MIDAIAIDTFLSPALPRELLVRHMCLSDGTMVMLQLEMYRRYPPRPLLAMLFENGAGVHGTATLILRCKHKNVVWFVVLC